VATPIGNLEDISARALEILNSVAVIAAEDTRHSKALLQRYQIATRMVSYHDFSNKAAVHKLLSQLEAGASIALISDAGTPLISDPGYRLVSAARDRGIAVFPVPGASALTAALSVAGLPTDRFLFEGFLPAKTSARSQRLQELSADPRTLVLYESSHRIVAALQDMVAVFGGARQIFVGRELTKKFETHYRGTLESGLVWLQEDSNQQKGEFVLVIAGSDPREEEDRQHQQALQVVALLREEMSLNRAVAIAARISGARKNRLYEAALADPWMSRTTDVGIVPGPVLV
jgi:16S rRNA (cytidine1402-2'-O)-methyltransferase